ncbi:transposase [Rhizosaccharibacter radicis]|uniref:transposase n=1 Tax=Rhizosaccharibacter radicis TaxID=2782605 RepID=UPI003BF49339
MPKLPLLSETQMRRLRRFFPVSRGLRRVDDRRVVNGIIYVIRDGLQWKDAPRRLWGARDALQPRHPVEPPRRVRAHLCGLGRQPGMPEHLMIDSTHLKAHRTAASLLQKGALDISAAPEGA